jgi:hypothetical protein
MALLSDVATATLNAVELLPVELAFVSTNPLSIEPYHTINRTWYVVLHIR